MPVDFFTDQRARQRSRGEERRFRPTLTLSHKHLHMLGRYHLQFQKRFLKGELRPFQ